MISPEVFYLHIQGEQRGPYTIPQIDHLLNCGLIGEETLYWREGLDQWHPVTDLVVVRHVPNPWIKPGIAAGVLVVLLILARMFGPITLEGWRETNQHEYTAEAAYWRARDLIRNTALPKGSVVAFDPLVLENVALKPGGRAVVKIYGEVTARSGQTHREGWQVTLKFDERGHEWSGEPAGSAPP
jgi:hypothetical protein